MLFKHKYLLRVFLLFNNILKGRKERKNMKKRKVLFLLPVAALILSGCSLQEGLEGIKGFIGTNFYGPAKSLIQSFLGNEEQKKEEKKDEEKQDQQGGGEKQDEDQQGGGEQGGGGGGTTTSDPREKYGTTHEGTEADPLTGADAVLIGGQLEESSSSNYLPTQESYYIKGEVQELEEEFDPQFGNYSFSIEEGFVGWRLKYGPSYQAFSEGDIAIGDTVTLYAPIMNFHGTSETKGGYVTRVEKPAIDAELVGVEITGEPQTAYVEGSAYNHDGLKLIASYDNNETQDVTLQAEWSINPATATLGDTEITITASFGKMSDDLVVNVTVTQKGSAEHQGTVDDPYTPTDILSLFADLNQDETSEEGVYLQGTIAAEPAPAVSKNRGNFWVSDGASSLYVYGANGLTNQADVTLDDLPVGGSVVVSGAVKNYKGSLQLCFVSGKGECQLISVEEPVISVESVELSVDHLDLEVGGQALLSASVTPSNASQELNWATTDASVATYADGKVTAVGVGSATITATSVADPTKSDSCTVTVTAATKQLTGVTLSGTPKTEYDEEEAYTHEGLVLTANYSDQSSEDVSALAEWTLSKETAEYGDTALTITATYGEFSDHMDVSVTVAIKHGSQSHPYTVAEARAAVDNGGDITGVYAEGYVSKIVTPYNSGFGNVSFDISADGLHEGDQLQGYRTTVASADDVAVGDKVVLKGNLKKYNDTYEFDAGNTIESRVQPTATLSVVVSGTASTTEYAPGASYSYEGLVAIATLDNGAKADVSSEASWSINPATATLGDTEIEVTATYNNVVSEAFAVSVTVTAAPIEQVYKSLAFLAANTSDSVSSYTATATYTDNGFSVETNGFNNNKLGWDFIKCGRKADASVATITTKAAIDKAVTKVNISFTTYTVVSGTTAKVLVSSSADMSNAAEYAFTPAANTTVAVPITTGVANAYYQVVFDCVAHGSTNGYIWVTAVSYSAVY